MRRFLKIAGLGIAAVLVLLILVLIALQTSYVQNIIAQRAVQYLSEQLDTRVDVENIRVRIPRSVRIEGLYIEDQQQDTLWYSGVIEVNLRMFDLLRNRLTVHSFLLDNVTANIYRTARNERFNYEFIVDEFAGNNDRTPQDEIETNGENGFAVSVNDVMLRNIRAHFNDEIGGDEARLELFELLLNIDNIDLDDMRFEVSRFGINGLKARIVQAGEAEPGENDTGETAPLDLIIDTIGFSSVEIEYENRIGGDYARLDLPALRMSDVSYGSGNNVVAASSLHIDTTNIIFRTQSEDAGNDAGNGFDFTDLDITGLNVHIEDVRYAGETARAAIHSITMRDHSGFVLEELTAQVSIDDQSARIDGLNVRTDVSHIRGSFAARYPSLETARENTALVEIEISLDESVFGFSDALLFQPDLQEQIQLDKGRGLTLSAAIDGTVGDMTIGKIEASMPENTYLRSHGRITGLPDIEAAVFNITLEEITSGRDDIHRLVAEEMLPEDIVIPPMINISGNYQGSISRFETFLDIRTTFGELAAQMAIDMREEEQSYRGNLIVSRFNVGDLLGDPDQLGMVSLTASVDGSGFELETMDAMLDATIDHVQLLGYDYSDIRIDGRIRERHFTGFAGMEDPNLVFDFNGEVQLADDDPRFVFDLNLGHADLHALQLTDEELAVSGTLQTDFRGASPETINGIIAFRNIIVVRDEFEFPVDSLIVTAETGPGHQHLTVRSDFLSADYDGTVNIAEVPALMTDHVDRYFRLHHHDPEDIHPWRTFTFNIELLQPELLTDILPGLHELAPATIEGRYRGANRSLNLNVDIPEIVYETYIVDSVRVVIESDIESLDYDLSASFFAMGGIEITAPELSGMLRHNVITSYIALHDSERVPVFTLGGTFESTDTVYSFSLIPGELVINYDRWSVPEENFVRFGGDDLFIHNLRLQRGESRILVQSIDDGTPAPPIEIAIRDLDITDFPRLIGNDELALSGMINARAELSDVLTEFKMNVQMTLENFAFRDSEVGNIEMLVQSEVPDRYDIEVNINQHENRAGIAGYVITGDEEEINLNIDIQNINLASIEGFTMGQLTDMSGSLTGELSVSGTFETPDINGSVNFREALFTIAPLNSTFLMNDEVIAFGRDRITFRNVTFVDTRDNRMVINGNVEFDDFTDYRFALDVTSTNFLLMDSQRRHNENFYGRIIVDSDIRIRGDQNLPLINADIALREGTNLTVFVADQDPQVIEREGIVEFVRMDEDHQPIRDEDDEPMPERTIAFGIELSANIDVDMETRFRVIIDEQAGDVLTVQGGGELSFGIDRSGLMSLGGRYEITEGAYQMTFYDVARRRFDIRPGSSIVWTGDLIDANIDITAIYTVRAQTSELVMDYVSEEQRQQYRQVLPYQVLLNMRGNLLTPDISFELDMPEEQRTALGGVPYQHVQRINEDETERNKQVFALLVLNRFLPENPFEIGEGAGMTATARTSASRILTQQLNDLSARYVRGFDISFDVESYEVYTPEGPEGRTELQVQITRRFLEDRLIVEVGRHFDLEGETTRNTNQTDLAGDVAVEYMLTEDGRFRIRGFRKTEFATLGEGEVISTGLSLVWTREFNRFRDLFQPPREAEAIPDPEIAEEGEEEQIE